MSPPTKKVAEPTFNTEAGWFSILKCHAPDVIFVGFELGLVRLV
jgi:hypothetical protein